MSAPKVGDILTEGPYDTVREHCSAIYPEGCYFCTAPVGHERGDIPHIASGLSHQVIAIWDNKGLIDNYAIAAARLDAEAAS